MFRSLFFALLTANLLFLVWSHWTAPQASLQAPPGVAAAPAHPASLPAAAPPPPVCTSLGPFRDADAVAQAASLLGAACKQPKPRTESVQQSDGFAVAITGLYDGPGQQGRLVALNRAGVNPVRAASDGTPRLLAGSFMDRAVAEQQAARLRTLKYEASVEEQFHSVQQHWLDLSGETPVTLSAPERARMGLTAPELVTAACP